MMNFSSLCPVCGGTIPVDRFTFAREAGILVEGARYVALPRREADILSILIDRPGKRISKQTLFELLYSVDDEPETTAVVESHVSKLRRKILPLGLDIIGERFVGYMLVFTNGRQPT